MRVIVIPEGVQYDHLILRPIFGAMFRHLGKRNAKIDIHSPGVRGFDAVRGIDYILAMIADFPTADLFVLCVDRDGDPHRREALNDLESKISKVLPAPRLFLAEHAWQEVEVWAMAGINWQLEAEVDLEVDPIVQTTRPGFFGYTRASLVPPRLDRLGAVVDLGGGAVGQALVPALVVVEREPSFKASLQLSYAAICFQVDLLIF